jgi:hypothetical protein
MRPNTEFLAIRRKVKRPCGTDLYLCLDSCLKDLAVAGESRVEFRGEPNR